MSSIFSNFYTLPIPLVAVLVAINGVPSATFKKHGKATTTPLTKNGPASLTPLRIDLAKTIFTFGDREVSGEGLATVLGIATIHTIP